MAELPESLPHLASPTPGRVGEVLGGAPQATAGGTHPALFRRTSVKIPVQGETSVGAVKDSVFQC